jgi:hypothetical protein
MQEDPAPEGPSSAFRSARQAWRGYLQPAVRGAQDAQGDVQKVSKEPKKNTPKRSTVFFRFSTKFSHMCAHALLTESFLNSTTNSP